MTECRTLGVAVIGLGVGLQHALAYSRSTECALRWVYDLDASLMARVVVELGEGAAAPAFETILEDSSVDLVSIASYDDAHFSQVMATLRTSKHVFVEKPLCRSIEELRLIKKAWRESGNRYLASNLVLRAAPVYRWLKERIGSGDLGRVYAFDGDYLYGRIGKITEGWRKDVKDYSVMQGGGIHLVDLMLWLSDQKPASVISMGNRICTTGTEFQYNDYVSATFQFPSGLIGRITANFGCVHRHQHVVRVFGTKGTFIYDDQGPRIHNTRDSSVSARMLELSPLPSSKGDLIPGFIKAILNAEDREAQAQHEYDVISACVAADKSLVAAELQEIEYV